MLWRLGSAEQRRAPGPALSKGPTRGAHGATVVRYINWNTKANRQVALSDLLTDGFEKPLTQIAEKLFRKREELSDSASLKPDYFFKDGKYQLIKFNNVQVFDMDGLAGRAFSSSYIPAKDTEAGAVFLQSLQELFYLYQVNGTVNFQYQTEIYLGRV